MAYAAAIRPCEPDAPHLIAQVVTGTAAGSDVEFTEQIHDGLARRELLPDVPLVDADCMDAALPAGARREHGIESLGPVSTDTGRRAKADDGYCVDHFTVDWDNER
ncbi:hypothetical protein [Streptomyces antibioticus]|uniref:hypothetical protein n=1 Tax=Streptomyces antibioticus TaxID=1890 RepID=UPI0033BDC7F7